MKVDERFKPQAVYTEYQVRIARNRLEAMQPLLNEERLTRAKVMQRVLEIRERSPGSPVGEGVEHISVASMYRWIRAFRQSGGDLSSLIPYVRHNSEVPRTRLDPAVEAIIDAVIEELYWSQARVSTDLVQDRIFECMQEAERSLPERAQLQPPSRTTIYRRTKAWLSRHGEIDYSGSGRAGSGGNRRVSPRANQPLTTLSPAMEQKKPERPNQYVEFDFAPLDVLVIDSEDRLPLGRPSITLLRDRYTGYPTACWVSFDPPSSHTVLECLYSCVLEKEDIRARYHTHHDYLGYGLPEVLILDRAREFSDPHLERVCRHLGIDVQFEAIVPLSLQGLFEQLRCIPLHGTSLFRIWRQEGKAQRFAACVSLDELWYALYHWIVDDVAQQAQQCLGQGQGVPAQLWQRASERGFIPRTLPKTSAAMLLLSRTVERRMRHEEIAFEHLIYSHGASYPPQHAGDLPRPNTPVQITYYPEDLSRLWVLDPSSPRAHELAAADQEYTAHLSLWKHRLIKQFARSHVGQDVDLAALRIAKARIQQLVAAECHFEKATHASGAVRKWFDPQIAWSTYKASPPSGDAPDVEPGWSKVTLYTGHDDQEKHSWRRNAMSERTVLQDTPLDPGHWRAMTSLERLALIERMVVKHNHLSPLIEELDTFASYSGAGSPHCLAILGEAGVGKTTLARSWIRTAQQPASEERQRQPYRYISLPAQATPKAILASLLVELGDTVPLRGAEWAMMERLQRALRTSPVRMLFIDDMQHLLNRDTQRIRYSCVEMLEHIIAQTGISMVFLGLRETEPIFSVSPRLEQLVGTPRILRPFEWNHENAATIQEFRVLLKTIDLNLPFDPSGLGEEETAYGIYYATDGILAWIMRLIRYASMNAIQAQEATLSGHGLAVAYNACIAQTMLGLGKLNPFSTPDFREGLRSRSSTRSNEKKVRKPIRYRKEGDHNDQGNI